MNKRTRMMLMNGGKEKDYEHERREYDRDRYDVPEDKFRDRKGREHYDSGRYAPRSEYGYGTEREYSPAMMDYNQRRYPPYVPPMYNKEYQPMNKIGFSLEGEMDRVPEWEHNYRSDGEYRHMNEMGYRHGGEQERGHYSSKQGIRTMKMDKPIAERWMAELENVDGTMGPHWNMEQAKQVMAQRGIDCDTVEFWVALNAMYSDYAKVAKELDVNNIDFYAKMAKAFLDDTDAMPNKLARYYEYVVKH